MSRKAALHRALELACPHLRLTYGATWPMYAGAAAGTWVHGRAVLWILLLSQRRTQRQLAAVRGSSSRGLLALQAVQCFAIACHLYTSSALLYHHACGSTAPRQLACSDHALLDGASNMVAERQLKRPP